MKSIYDEEYDKKLADYERRVDAYKSIFMPRADSIAPLAQIVLSDLRRYCSASTSTVRISSATRTIDPIAMGVAEGRRDVFNRIMSYLYDDRNDINEYYQKNKE